MTFSYIPYPEYKDSGWSWLGKIPVHWDTVPGLAVFREKKDKNIGLKEKQVLSLSYGKIVIKPPEKLHGLVPESFETYQIVEPGDIIIRSTDLQNDWTSLRVGLVNNRGIITSAYICLNIRDRILPEFAYLLLHTYDLKKYFYGMGSGLRQNLDFSDLKRMIILVPPTNEQIRIVKFAKWLEYQTNRYIRAKRRQIELLNEQKQVIIHQAVTRGLDPSVRMKPSGVEWLGEIPEHWKVERIKTKVKNNIEQTDKKLNDDIYIALENVESWTGKLLYLDNDVVFESQVKRFQPDDLLFGKLRPYLAKVVIPRKSGVCVSEFFVLRSASNDINMQYLEYILRSKQFINNINYSTFGAKMPRTSWEIFGGTFIPIPLLHEQFSIVDFISRSILKIDKIIDANKLEISLLQELRARFIVDLVTGKLDVKQLDTISSIIEEMPETDYDQESEDEINEYELINTEEVGYEDN